jgi:hypothetical protein
MLQPDAGRQDTLPSATAAARLQPHLGVPSSSSCQQNSGRRCSAWRASKKSAMVLLTLAALAAVTALPPFYSSPYPANSNMLQTQHSRPLVQKWTGLMAAQRRLLQQSVPPQQSQAAQQAQAAQQTQTGDITLDGADMMNLTRTGQSYNNPDDFPVPEGYECVLSSHVVFLSLHPVLRRHTGLACSTAYPLLPIWAAWCVSRA